MRKTVTKLEKFGEEEIETIYRETRRPAPMNVISAMENRSWDGMEEKTLEGAAHGFCAEFNQRTFIAEHGILCEQDIPVTLRDGTIIYTDIYRPANESHIPAIVSWSYFGKRPGDGMDEWQLIGVPPGTVSKMAKFESPDPAYWCHMGYAVANVDPRGVGHSGGDINMFGTQDARDGYDFIEWLARQWWCNGKIGMAGNSGVAMVHWRIAAEQPPHLACIAPWEATGDLYRESLFEGGIPALSFSGFIQDSLTGLAYADDTVSMAKKYPYMNAYWKDKIPQYHKIRIPAYVTASWSHFHLRGSLEGFRKIRSTKKWLRTHREFEWPDTYTNRNLEDLRKFYDRYLKDIRNGWELTPRVRLEVMDSHDIDYQTDRPERAFPIARTEYKKLYVDAAKRALSFEPSEDVSKLSYEAETGLATFDIAFAEEIEITGYMKLRLWVEADGNNDMDLFIAVQKLDCQGNFLPTSVLGEDHPGAWGKIRASRRELDEKLSSKYQPVQAHLRDQFLSPGEIVPVDIEIWPHSRIWHRGEQLRVRVSGRYIREGWFEPFSWETNNRGRHVIHSGGRYDSYLQIPVVPPRLVAGDYVHR